MAENEKEKAIENELDQEKGQEKTAETAGEEEAGGTQPEAAVEGDAAEEAQEPSEEAEEAPEGVDPKSWAEKRAAKKQAKQDKKTQAYKEQIEQLEDKVKRQLAEFENFRNRTEKEKHGMFEVGAKSVIEKMLPVVDNFERGLAAVPEEQKEDPFVTGMDKVYKQLMTEFEAIGVAAIEAVGKEFDPELHNAVMQVEDEEKEAGTVAAELQKGYRYKDTVVRHSMVSVVS